MAPSPLNPEHLPASTVARGVCLAGLVLAALYLVILAGSFFPIQLLNPAWQLKVGSALINASSYPLVGLALLHLAVVVDPADRLLARRQWLASRLAVVAALGFLLLLPLLTVASVSDLQQRSIQESGLIGSAERNLQALRQVVASANSTSELRDRLIALNAPILDQADQALPLPRLKAQVNGLIDQIAAKVARRKEQLPPFSPWTLLPKLLRNGFACLLLALGFAGLAQRPGSNRSLLAELQDAWYRLRLRRSFGWGRADRNRSDADYLERISQERD